MLDKIIPINKIYSQTKQRVDIQLDFNNCVNNQPVESLTKLYFKIVNEDLNIIKDKISDYNNETTKHSNKESNLNNLNINLDLTHDYHVREDIDFKKHALELNLHTNNSIIQYIDIEYYNDDSFPKTSLKKNASNKNFRLAFNYMKPENEDSYFKSIYAPCKSSSCYTNTSRVRQNQYLQLKFNL